MAADLGNNMCGRTESWFNDRHSLPFRAHRCRLAGYLAPVGTAGRVDTLRRWIRILNSRERPVLPAPGCQQCVRQQVISMQLCGGGERAKPKSIPAGRRAQATRHAKCCVVMRGTRSLEESPAVLPILFTTVITERPLHVDDSEPKRPHSVTV